MGAVWLHQWGVPWHGPLLPNGSKCFLVGGLGQPLGWASWAQTGSGPPRPKWRVGGTRSCPTLSPSTDELKSKEDPFGGTGLAGATPFPVGVGGRVLLGWVSPGGGKKESLSLLPRVQGASQPGPHRAGLP